MQTLKVNSLKVHSARLEEFQLFHFVFLLLFDGTLSNVKKATPRLIFLKYIYEIIHICTAVVDESEV